MAGHSKWNNIKRKKGANDQKRAKIFTKIGREMAVAVKSGGADPAQNSKLRDCIAKAKGLNVPNDNIERIIKKASGEGDTSSFEHCVYEGYGPAGVALIVECLTDNRNRTAGDMRHYFDKYGGNLDKPGSVMFSFVHRGLIIVEPNSNGDFENRLMEDALTLGAVDIAFDDGVFEVITPPGNLGEVREGLEQKGYSVASAQREYHNDTSACIEGEDAEKLEKLLDILEDNDDVQDVWHNLNS